MTHVGRTGDEAEVARVLLAVGDVMAELHSRSLRLQDAVSALASGTAPDRTLLHDLQGLDLTTQIHADLARFLPVLAREVSPSVANREALRDTLTLSDLKQRLIECGDAPPVGEAGGPLFF